MNYGTINGTYNGDILLLAGGSITNGSSGDRVALIQYGIAVRGDAGTIVNYGTISDSDRTGIYLHAGGNVTNHLTGWIDGSWNGIIITGYSGATIANAGTILGGGNGDGVYLRAGGVATNQKTGVIAGGTGVAAIYTSAIVANGGSISGTAGNGVYLGAGGAVTNAASAHISGAKNGVSLRGLGSVSNAGTIIATVGVFLAAGGYVTNSDHGLIKGSADGVLVSGGNVTVTNAATLSGSTYSLQFKGGGTDTLIVDPGAVFVGKVSGASATSALVLASAAGAGTLTGLGTQFTGFKTVTENAGAKWIFAGTNSLASTTVLAVNGVLTYTGKLTVASSIIGTGSVSISSSSVLSVGGRLGAAGLKFLSGGHETAILGAPTAVSAMISGFRLTSDTIDVVGFVATTHSFAGHSHTLTVDAKGGSVAHLTFAASYTTEDFHFATDHHGGTNITFV